MHTTLVAIHKLGDRWMARVWGDNPADLGEHHTDEAAMHAADAWIREHADAAEGWQVTERVKWVTVK